MRCSPGRAKNRLGHGSRRSPTARVVFAVVQPALLLLSADCDRINPLPAGPRPAEVRGPDAFVDITERLGDAARVRGWGGLAVFDYDNDGDLDIFIPGDAGASNRLLQNDGLAHFVDVADAVGLAMVEGSVSACGVGDLNNDGRLDLILARQPFGVSPDASLGAVILLNEASGANGASFRRLTAEQSGLTSEAPALSVGVGDLDNDGRLDLLIGVHDFPNLLEDLNVPIYPSHPNELWRCTAVVEGVPRYEQITTAGIEGTRQAGASPETADQTFVPGTYAVYMTDVDEDGRLDLFDLHDTPGGIDYFHNEGNLTFAPRQTDLLNRHGGWMGMCGGDYDGDGDSDYFATNVGSDFVIFTPPTSFATTMLLPNGTKFHHLLLNDGGVLRDVAAETPVSPSTALPPWNLSDGVGLQAYEFGFGCTWIDTDNRGRLDLYWIGDVVGLLNEITGWPLPPLPVDAHGVGRFLANNGDGTFTDATAERGLFDIPADRRIAFGQNEAGRALATCDLNGDGFRDLVVINGSIMGTEAASTRIFLNPGSTGNHYLTVRLVGTVSNRFGIGARIKARIGDRTYAGEVLSTTGAFCGVQPEAHFGLGAADSVDELQVFWPSGRVTTLPEVKADQILTIEE